MFINNQNNNERADRLLSQLMRDFNQNPNPSLNFCSHRKSKNRQPPNVMITKKRVLHLLLFLIFPAPQQHNDQVTEKGKALCKDR